MSTDVLLENVTSQLQTSCISKGRPKKILTEKELQLRKEKIKYNRDLNKLFQNLRKYNELYEKVFALIFLCQSKKVINCIENIELCNKFLTDLKYL